MEYLRSYKNMWSKTCCLAAASRNISRQLAIPVRKVSAKKMRNVRFVASMSANLLLNRYAVSLPVPVLFKVSTMAGCQNDCSSGR